MTKLLFSFSYIFLLISCSSGIQAGPQIQGATSPNGQYQVLMKTNNLPEHSNEKYRNTPLWITHIIEGKKTTYIDDASLFVATSNIYWGWDEKNQLWVYNSDDGQIYFWAKQNDTWIKNAGSFNSIPKEILPGYVQKK